MRVIKFYKPNEENGYLCLDYHCSFFMDGYNFTTVNQYVAYSKAKIFNDEYRMKKILSATTAGEIRELIKGIGNVDAKVWNGRLPLIYYKGNYAKFDQNEDLRQLLLDTGDTMIAYCNKNDKTNGIGLYGDDTRIYKTTSWQGQNLLGFNLMEVRDTLRNTL